MDSKQASLDRAQVVAENFVERVKALDFPVPKSSTTFLEAGCSPQTATLLFRAQVLSRHLDLIARQLRRQNQSFYTIGSSGHEGNAAIAAHLEAADMAFLHYRSGAFMLARAMYLSGQSLCYDHVLALVASKTDPISSGRHKVFGSDLLNVPPQTSTIASHLPKAVGAAFSVALAKDLKCSTRIPNHGVVVCSFGDASANHSTAQGALNAAQWIQAHHLPLPIVFVCEDNALGISVPTQKDWIENTFASRPGLTYFQCDGLNLADTYQVSQAAVHLARTTRSPVFLHIKTVRLLGHAGSDIEFHYRTPQAIQKTESDDPLLHTACKMHQELGWSGERLLNLYETVRDEIEQCAEKAIHEPKLNRREDIMASIIPPPKAVKLPTPPTFTHAAQSGTMAQLINWTLRDLLVQYSNVVLFGEDVGTKGGVYRVTANLQKEFGPRRVFDSLLDEQTILGTAIGMAHNGILPIPEIQFLAYVHNAIDQIRGEAATLSFFSNGLFTNPMVCRIPGLAYQKGFGGHFHNDNSIAALRDIPGVVIACPSNGAQAAKLLRRCVALAYQQQRVVLFIEPIALYHTKDLFQPGDNQWIFDYPSPTEMIEIDTVVCEGESDCLTIVSYGNGVWLSKQAIRQIEQQAKCRVALVDLQWLAPLPMDALIQAVGQCPNVLIVDEGRQTGAVSETLITRWMELCPHLPRFKRVTGADCFIPLGESWPYVLPSVEEITEAGLKLLQSNPTPTQGKRHGLKSAKEKPKSKQ